MKNLFIIPAIAFVIVIFHYSCSNEYNDLGDSVKQDQLDTLNFLPMKVGICNVDQIIGPEADYNCFGFAFQACETGVYEELSVTEMYNNYFASGLFKEGGVDPSKVLYWDNGDGDGDPREADHAAMITNDKLSEYLVRSKEGLSELRENCIYNYYLSESFTMRLYSLNISLTCIPQNPKRGDIFKLTTAADGRNLGVSYNWAEFDPTAFELIEDLGYQRKFKIKDNARLTKYDFSLIAVHQSISTGLGSNNEAHKKSVNSKIISINLPPLPVFSVSISGAKCIPVNRTTTWTVLPINGSAPYTYYWDCIIFNGTLKTYKTSNTNTISFYCKAGNRITGNVTVTDKDGRIATAPLSVFGDCPPID